jgi:hypothetical protein
MTLLTGWPTLTDDAGDGTSGTVLDKSVFDTIKSEIENVTHSTNNTTVDPKDTTDDVVTAHGNKASLEARISGVIDSDGALVTPASLTTQAQLQAELGASINLVKNSTFWIWTDIASKPVYWQIANGTGSIAGTGQTDTERYVGKYCYKSTWSSGTATLTQTVISTADFGNLDHLKVETKKFGLGCWVNSSIASQARIQVDDGNTTTESSYHSGTTGWEWLSLSHTMSAASTKLDVVLQNVQSGSCYFSGVVGCFSDVAPVLWYPEPKMRGSLNFYLPGQQSTGDGKLYFSFARPVRLDHCQGTIVTAPTGASLNIDIEKYRSGWESLGTAGALIDAGDQVGQWLFTTTAADFEHLCFNGWYGASGAIASGGNDNKMGRINIDQVGSTVPGSDLFLRLDGVQCVHPFEDQYTYSDLGVSG